MTMAVGFCCKDGVVIAADRQVTGTNFTFPECKLLSFLWRNGTAIAAYSGDRDTSKVFAREMSERLDGYPSLTDAQIRNLLKESIEASASKKETFLVLFGYWLDDEFPCLVMSTNKRKIVDVRDCEVIGYADSPLARYFLGRFRQTPHYATVHQARLYAINFISQAKKYDGQYIGDSIDVFSIDCRVNAAVKPEPIGTLTNLMTKPKKYLRALDSAQTEEWGKEIDAMSLAMDTLFGQVTNDEKDVSLDDFIEKLRAFREWSGGDSIE
jgi:hypothetical protein